MKLSKINVIPQSIAVGLLFQMVFMALCAIGYTSLKFPTEARFMAVNILAMGLCTIGAFGAIFLAKAKHYMTPTRFRADMIVVAVALLAAFGFAVWRKCDSWFDMLTMVLGVVALPLYEGVVYRGLMWHKIKKVYHNKLITWLVQIGVITLCQLLYTYNIYELMLLSGNETLIDPMNIVIGIGVYGLGVNTIVGAVRCGVHNFLLPALVHAIINFVLIYLLVL